MIQEILQRSAVFLRMVAKNGEGIGIGGEHRDFGGPFVPLGSDAFNKTRLDLHYNVGWQWGLELGSMKSHILIPFFPLENQR